MRLAVARWVRLVSCDGVGSGGIRAHAEGQSTALYYSTSLSRVSDVRERMEIRRLALRLVRDTLLVPAYYKYNSRQSSV